MWDYFAIVGILAHVLVAAGVGLYFVGVAIVKSMIGVR